MPDRPGPLFGFFPVPETEHLGRIRDDVAYADRAGLDVVGIQDHPYQRRYVDTLSLIAWLAARTERIRFFPDVANLPLRPPAVLAKAMATIDVLSGGRVELGLGAGGFPDATAAFGGPRRSPGEAVAALEEAIAVVRAVWSGESGVRVGGEYYRLEGAKTGPVPAHRIEVWLGASGPRMLALTGRLADGWVPSSGWAPPDKLIELGAVVDEAAAAAGRDPASVRRVYNVSGRITDRSSKGFLVGPPDQWVAEVAELVTERRVGAVVLWPDAGDPSGQLRRYAEEVVPGVRAELAPGPA